MSAPVRGPALCETSFGQLRVGDRVAVEDPEYGELVVDPVLATVACVERRPDAFGGLRALPRVRITWLGGGSIETAAWEPVWVVRELCGRCDDEGDPTEGHVCGACRALDPLTEGGSDDE